MNIGLTFIFTYNDSLQDASPLPYLFPLINAIINKLHNKEEVHVRKIPKFEY